MATGEEHVAAPVVKETSEKKQASTTARTLRLDEEVADIKSINISVLVPEHFVVQGRYDVCCPMMSAWDLHKAWPESEFKVVADAGHSANEVGIAAELSIKGVYNAHPTADVFINFASFRRELRGFGFIQYFDPEDASDAKYHMDGKMLLGREIVVVFAEENRKKPC
ncbi:Proline iminopeptidase [Zea mays]|uniref:Proline iminopeptidase n=1 Tax=Zea mays TaxID=4577 RepID=A0A3L6EEE6_MAIZE|nr:Proline iminopeptidase [Zea mays]